MNGSPWDEGWIVFSVLLKGEAFKKEPLKRIRKKKQGSFMLFCFVAAR